MVHTAAYQARQLLRHADLQSQWPQHAILRSSIIYGPLSPTPVPRTLFLQFIDRALCEGNPTTFFEDEYRCPVYVNDIKVRCKFVALLLCDTGDTETNLLPPHVQDVVRTLVSGEREPLPHR